MAQTGESNKLLDLVDDTDSVIGTVGSDEIINLLEEPVGYVRAVGGLIMNANGELWVPIRSSERKIAPHGRDFSAGGHVKSGETYAQAMARVFAEGLGLAVQEAELRYIGKMGPVAGLPYFHGIFVHHSDEVPKYNTDDFSSYEWITPQELSKRLRVGVPAKAALLPAVELLIRHQQKQG